MDQVGRILSMEGFYEGKGKGGVLEEGEEGRREGVERCFVLQCFVLQCFVLQCFVLQCFVLQCFVLQCFVLQG